MAVKNTNLRKLIAQTGVTMMNEESFSERAERIIAENACKMMKPVIEEAQEDCKGKARIHILGGLQQGLASLEDVRLNDAVAELCHVFRIIGHDHYGEGTLWDAQDIHPAGAAHIRHKLDMVLYFLIG